ncbi:enoyl-CoA hydratase/isomerase family protein [Mycolicibacterium vaccae]|uniref:Enoyl-CoA hydratase n=2 Tax=Mycolicibacterium vaccae TaxID=1810 RepID=K0VC41_MYCVA|nr:enoyl-CoA hydratase-related protein [Mycolicibacterium vaccae]ANI39000.1 enoyl-CoA hydratase [Mycolicibacterium vaccae 95051]EJZ12368.1 enoyl-CoA hydratase [Mycolicibacterium vaccae ATCC 25954]MCV7062546.1 enoyl-CoA hydratase/isomerase family protein [Mycolicibacterium vaccae]
MTHAHARSVDTGTDTVRAEIVDRVAVLTFHRPQRRNALHPEMYEAVPRLLEQFAESADVGCVLVTGAGNAFCAGGDVRDGGSAKDVPAGDPEEQIRARSALLADNARMVTLLHSMPKVTIAALPGAAVGAGMSIALATDLRIAARSARLIPGWAKLAFSGDFGGAWLLTHLVGPSRALELLVGDAPIDAAAGERLGLFNRVVDDADLPAAAQRWAAEIAAGPTAAFAGAKANILDAQRLSLAEALLPESARMVRSALTQEHRDAVRAWLASASNKVGARS